MPKKYLIVLFFMAFVGAGHAVPLQGLPLLSDTAFAQLQEDGQPCPPECVTDSMEIVTWYPSPYNEYEELRLYPVQRDDNYCDNAKIGLMYYDDGGTPSFGDDDKMRVCKGTELGWQEVGGGFWQQSLGSNISNTNSGNVGIGTANPSAGGEQDLKLDVEGAIGARYYCDQDGNNCASAPLGGGGWVDITSDTDPWNIQCDYKVQVVSGCGAHNGDMLFVGGIFVGEGYMYAEAGHFLYVHYSNKGRNVPAGSEALCGDVPVRVYEKC